MRSSGSGGLEAALFRYKVMAWVVGVGLLVLVLVGVPLQLAAGDPQVVRIVGPVHGLLYVVYLVSAFDLSRRAHIRPGRMLLMFSAGLVPFLAFYVEAQVTMQIRGESSRRGDAHVGSESGAVTERATGHAKSPASSPVNADRRRHES